MEKKQSNFIGISFKLFKNNYKNKPTSFEYKGDGDQFFLKKVGDWLRSPEVVEARKQNRPIKVGVRTVEDEDKTTGGLIEKCEISLYMGQAFQKRGTQFTPNQQKQRNTYQDKFSSNDDDMDDEIPNDFSI